MDHQRTSRARPTPARAATALASALLAILALSACGSSSKPTATTSATAAAATALSATSTTPAKLHPGATHPARPESRAFAHALSKFAVCLRAHGIKLPEPRTPGIGPVFDTKGVNTKSAQFRSAETACSGALRASLPPTAGTRSTPPAESQADLHHKYSKFIACVGKYGVHLSAPSSDGGLVFSGPETKSPKFRTAEIKCESTISLSSPAEATRAQPGLSAATEQKAAQERLRAQVKRAKIPATVQQGFHNFSVCMRANGVSNYPEPEGMSFNTSKLHIDENTAQFKAASKKCEPILNAAVDPQSTQPPAGG